jgi:hypothetical protein
MLITKRRLLEEKVIAETGNVMKAINAPPEILRHVEQ